MSETFDEAVARLRRETRLSEQIDELAGYVGAARGSVPGLGYLFTGPQLAVLLGQLRELRARRMAAGRKPDDEVNAAADLACPCGQLEGNCDCDGVPRRLSPDGWSDDPVARSSTVEVLRVSPSDGEVLALCAQLEHHRETLRELAGGKLLLGDCWEAVGTLKRREPWLFEAQGEPLLKPECTGLTARWCPVHGDCTCTAEPWNEHDLNEPDCPLHGTASDHAEAPPDPEAIAQRILGKLGPELAAAVCVQLLGRLQRREP